MSGRYQVKGSSVYIPGLASRFGAYGSKEIEFWPSKGKKIKFWQSEIELLAKYTSSRINDSGTQTVKLRKLSLAIWGLVSVDW